MREVSNEPRHCFLVSSPRATGVPKTDHASYDCHSYVVQCQLLSFLQWNYLRGRCEKWLEIEYNRRKIAREVGFINPFLLGRVGETFLAHSSSTWAMHASENYRNIAPRKQKTREKKAGLTSHVENALSEALKLTSSLTSQVTSAKTPGWTVEDWQLKHSPGRKHSWFHGSPVIPGWHQHVRPSEGHTAHTTSPAAPWLARSLLSFPWHENTTKEGVP